MNTIAQNFHEYEMCTSIEESKWIIHLWYGGQWLKYKNNINKIIRNISLGRPGGLMISHLLGQGHCSETDLVSAIGS